MTDWIYVKDLLPCPNEKVLLSVVDENEIEHQMFGKWNEKFFETMKGEFINGTIVAWMNTKSPILTKEQKLEKLAEKYAKDRTNYELEYAKTLGSLIDKHKFMEWVKNHIFTSVKKAFIDGSNTKV